MPAYKKLVMAKPKQVVKTALRDAAAGKGVSVYGLPMKAFGLVCKLVPHDMILRFMQ